MVSVTAVVLSALLGVSWCAEDLTFPPGFKFGVASAAYQVEGAWNISDKGENIWDRFIHENLDATSDGSNGDVACDSYHQWRRDIEMASDLGVHYYRISISWSRVLPTGFPNRISEDGKNYYSNLIDGLLEKGIEPLVTLYHWDLPQRLQDLGGWTNPLISDWFADYARVVYSLYADRVKTWITINEPLVMCEMCYNSGIMAPGVVDPDVATFLCNKHVLIAHAKAWRVYDEEFRSKYHGEVSIANHHIWIEPASEDDEALAELARQDMVRYVHPIFSKEGGWPRAIEKILADNSKQKGYITSNLPAFTREEIEFVKGTYDFYGMNHYTSRLIRKAKEGEKLGQLPMGDDPNLNAAMRKNPDWPTTSSSWFHVYPAGIRRQLAWLKQQYGDMKFLITENGFANKGGMEDLDRIEYYRDYLKQILLSIKEDGVNVAGYTAWTLMDNFEWMDGYESKFGLYEVDFSSPQRTRTPRASAHYYKNIIKSHSLNVSYHSEL